MGHRPDPDRVNLFIIPRAKCEILPNSKVYAHDIVAERRLPPTRRVSISIPPVRKPDAAPLPHLQRIDHPKLLLHRAHRPIKHVRRSGVRRTLRLAKRPHQRPTGISARLDAHFERTLGSLFQRPRVRTRGERGPHHKRRPRIHSFRARAVQLSQPAHNSAPRFRQKRKQLFGVIAVRRARREIGAQRVLPRTELIVRCKQLPDHPILTTSRETRTHATTLLGRVQAATNLDACAGAAGACATAASSSAPAGLEMFSTPTC